MWAERGPGSTWLALLSALAVRRDPEAALNHRNSPGPLSHRPFEVVFLALKPEAHGMLRIASGSGKAGPWGRALLRDSVHC